MARRVFITLAAVAIVAAVGSFLWARFHRVTAPDYAAPALEAAAAQAPEPPAGQGLAEATGARRSKADPRMAFEALKALASQGDRVAQRKLAQAYHACFEVNVPAGEFQRGIEKRSRRLETGYERANLQRLARKREAECRWVNDGAAVPPGLSEHWFEQAAQNGDVVAQTWVRMDNYGTPDAAQSAALLQRVLASHDPEAVYLLGYLVGTDGLKTGDPKQDELLSGTLAGFAWNIAACRMGHACEPQGDVMDELCLSMNDCTADDFESLIRVHALAEEDKEVMDDLDDKVEQILALLETR